MPTKLDARRDDSTGGSLLRITEDGESVTVYPLWGRARTVTWPIRRALGYERPVPLPGWERDWWRPLPHEEE